MRVPDQADARRQEQHDSGRQDRRPQQRAWPPGALFRRRHPDLLPDPDHRSLGAAVALRHVEGDRLRLLYGFILRDGFPREPRTSSPVIDDIDFIAMRMSFAIVSVSFDLT